ncbi:hypothetical protein MKW92_003625, partial [Papaver armeniacum]
KVIALNKKLATLQGGLARALKERDSSSRQLSSSSQLVAEVSQERDDLRKAKDELQHSYYALDQEHQSFIKRANRKYSKVT